MSTCGRQPREEIAHVDAKLHKSICPRTAGSRALLHPRSSRPRLGGRAQRLAGEALAVPQLRSPAAISRRQGATDGTPRVPFVAGFLAVCGLLALLGAITSRPRLQLALVSFSGAGAFIFGILGLFAVGLLFLIVASPLVIAVAKQRVPRMAGLAALLTAAAAALVVTSRRAAGDVLPGELPSKEATYGSGTGFLTGGYTWSCVDGKLTVGPSRANPNSGSSPPQAPAREAPSWRLSPNSTVIARAARHQRGDRADPAAGPADPRSYGCRAGLTVFRSTGAAVLPRAGSEM